MPRACAVCGFDCTDSPVVKDKKGRYYCPTCVEKIKKKRQAAGAGKPQAAKSPKTAAAKPKPAVRAAAVTESTDALDQLAALEASAPAHHDPDAACPGCGRTLPESTRICIACGYHKDYGKRLPPMVKKSSGGGGGGGGGLSAIFSQPWILGVVPAVVLVGLFMVSKDNLALTAVYTIVMLVSGLGISIWIISDALSEGVLAAVLAFACAPYTLYYLIKKCDNVPLKYAYGGVFLANVIVGVMQGVAEATAVS